MTTDVAEREAQVTDQEPEETQTEDAPQLELEAVAAETPTAAAEEPDRISKLEAELQSLRQQQEERDRKARDDQRRRQRQNGVAALEKQRQEQDDQEATMLLRAQLLPFGVDDHAAIKPILDGYAQKREGQTVQRTLGDVGDAFSAAAAEALGADHDITLSARAEGYVANFEPFVRSLIDKGREAAETKLKAEGWLSPDEVAKAISAGVTAKQIEQQNGKRPLEQPEGSASVAETDEARVNRIISGQRTPDDEKWWNERFGRRR